MKLGRLQPAAEDIRRALKMADYAVQLPTPPASVNYSAAAMASLHSIFDNDRLGDCVIAAGYHVRGVTSGNAGKLYVPTDADIIKDYGIIGGYVPGRPATDQGCDEITAFKQWTKTGFQDGTKLLGWLAVDITNPTLWRQAMYLFENLYYVLQLPSAYLNVNGDGFTWDVAGRPIPQNGHAIMAMSYGPGGSQIGTWGMVGNMTEAAMKKYLINGNGGGAYVLLSADTIAAGQQKAPNGMAWADLIADFNAMGGNLPVPAPPTPVPPSPVPPPPAPAPVGAQTITIVCPAGLVTINGKPL